MMSSFFNCLISSSISFFCVLINEKMMTARIRFMRKNYPTMIIEMTNITPTAGMSTAMKFSKYWYPMSELLIWNTLRRLEPRLSKFVIP